MDIIALVGAGPFQAENRSDTRWRKVDLMEGERGDFITPTLTSLTVHPSPIKCLLIRNPHHSAGRGGGGALAGGVHQTWIRRGHRGQRSISGY